MKLLDQEEWGVNCFDNFEAYWGKHANKKELEELAELRNEWNKQERPDGEIYQDAVSILHNVWVREMGKEHKQPMDCELIFGEGEIATSKCYAINNALRVKQA